MCVKNGFYHRMQSADMIDVNMCEIADEYQIGNILHHI